MMRHHVDAGDRPRQPGDGDGPALRGLLGTQAPPPDVLAVDVRQRAGEAGRTAVQGDRLFALVVRLDLDGTAVVCPGSAMERHTAGRHHGCARRKHERDDERG